MLSGGAFSGRPDVGHLYVDEPIHLARDGMRRRSERLKFAILDESSRDRRKGPAYTFDYGLDMGRAFLRRAQEVDRKRTQRLIRIGSSVLGRLCENGCDVSAVRATDDPPAAVDQNFVSAIA